jgi:hypothetical protein
MTRRIMAAEPIAALKKSMCKTDEAEVSRILSGKYKGMVERLQGNEIDLDHRFDISYKGEIRYPYHGSPSYHMMKFVSLLFAGVVFPDNVVRMRELRLSVSQAATYSDYVPDDNGVIERRAAAMREFYRAASGSEGESESQLRIREKANEGERRFNPDLMKAAEKMREAGIIIAHPEANYHVTDGRTVFFEISGLDMSDALSVSSGNERALKLLSLIYALHLRDMANNMQNNGSVKEYPTSRQYLDYNRVYEAVYNIFIKTEPHRLRMFLEEGNNLLKRSLHDYRYGLKGFEVPPMPVRIDPKVFGISP